VLTFFGFMHGEAIGLAQTPLVAASYLIVAAVLLGCAKSATVVRPAAVPEHATPAPGAAD
jgi:AGZA family xanthine/uracil permease-like MFS transporter